ncbi:hypothetical protein SCB49_08418 [unidentified eubacterium SCB49]|nr:hypothetical protein SCB49_08418 [unidentified eubacterium SCB49]
MALKHNFRKLTIWKESRELVSITYRMTKAFPKHETYGLSSQIQRCSISIASNIAEGSARNSNKHFVQYLETSLGSSFEWETQLICAYDLGYIEEQVYNKHILSIHKLQAMISNFKNTLL